MLNVMLHGNLAQDRRMQPITVLMGYILLYVVLEMLQEILKFGMFSFRQWFLLTIQ